MKYVLFADIPPIENGGKASHSIAWSLSEAMRGIAVLCLTRRFHRDIDLKKIRSAVQIPTFFYPDLWWLGLRRWSDTLRFSLDTLLFILCFPLIIRLIRKSGADRVFAFPFNHWCFLINAWLVEHIGKIPVELYLVDDLEASALMQGKCFRARITRWVEQAILPSLTKVWVISPGFAEHLNTKYGVKAYWLPVVVRATESHFRQWVPQVSKVVGFSGSLNGLYRAPLEELYQAVKSLNREGKSYKIRLFVASMPNLSWDWLKDSEAVEFVVGCPNKVLVEKLSDSWVNFLPYSFEVEMKTMVSTAFSCKIAEYFAAGRPMMVYGPSYASIPRYFRDHNLPLVQGNEGGLLDLIKEVDCVDQQETVDSYDKLLKKYHSASAFLNILRN